MSYDQWTDLGFAVGAWFPVFVTLLSLVTSLRLLTVPGAYGAWRLAWLSLFGAGLILVLLSTRDALLSTDVLSMQTTWLMQRPVRLVAASIAAIGFYVCTRSCLTIFRPREMALLPPVPLIRIASDGTVMSWNTAAEQMFGYTPAQAYGQELAGLIIPERFQAAHREGLAKAANGGPMPALDRPFETMGRHQDGHEIPVEITITRHRTREQITYLGHIRLQGPRGATSPTITGTPSA